MKGFCFLSSICVKLAHLQTCKEHCYKWMKAAEKPVTKSRILNHTKLEKYVYTHIIHTCSLSKGENLHFNFFSSLFFLSGDSRKKCVSGEKEKNGKGHYLHINF